MKLTKVDFDSQLLMNEVVVGWENNGDKCEMRIDADLYQFLWRESIRNERLGDLEIKVEELIAGLRRSPELCKAMDEARKEAILDRNGVIHADGSYRFRTMEETERLTQ